MESTTYECDISIPVLKHRRYTGERMTLVEPDELASNHLLEEEELHLFLRYGGTDINKTHKTPEEIKLDNNKQ